MAEFSRLHLENRPVREHAFLRNGFSGSGGGEHHSVARQSHGPITLRSFSGRTNTLGLHKCEQQEQIPHHAAESVYESLRPHPSLRPESASCTITPPETFMRRRPPLASNSRTPDGMCAVALELGNHNQEAAADHAHRPADTRAP